MRSAARSTTANGGSSSAVARSSAAKSLDSPGGSRPGRRSGHAHDRSRRPPTRCARRTPARPGDLSGHAQTHRQRRGRVSRHARVRAGADRRHHRRGGRVRDARLRQGRAADRRHPPAAALTGLRPRGGRRRAGCCWSSTSCRCPCESVTQEVLRRLAARYGDALPRGQPAAHRDAHALRARAGTPTTPPTTPTPAASGR